MNRLPARNPVTLSSSGDDPFPAPRSPLQRYGVALLAVAAAMALSLLFHDTFSAYPTAIFFFALVVSVTYGGLGPGLLVTAISLPFINYFFLEPYFIFKFNLSTLIGLSIFTLAAFIMALAYDARQRAEAAQRESRKQFEVILQGVVDGITVQSLTGNLTYANAAAARMTNFPSAEALVAAPMIEILRDFDVMDEAGDPLTPEKFPNSLAFQGIAAQTVVCFRTISTGVERWSILKSTPVFDEQGKVYQSVNLFQDITALKQAQQAAFDQREQLRVTLASIGDGVIATDTLGKVTFINDVASKLTGWSESEAVGQDVENIFHIVNEDTREAVENPIRRVLVEGIIVGLANHTVLIAKDGKEIPIDDSGAPIKNGQGSIIGVVLVFRDITERKQADDALRNKEEELREFLENAVTALHWVGPDGTILWANRAELDLLGYTSEEYIGHHIAEFHADIDVITDILDCLTRGEKIQSYDARLRRKDGAIRHVLIDSNVMFKNGQFSHTRCFTRDITDRVLAEERYKLLAEALPQFVWIGPTEGSAEFCNRFWYEYTGLSVEQTLGTGWTDVLHPADHARMQQRWEQASEAGTDYELELRFRRGSDGQYRWHLARIFPLHDAAGRIYKWLGTATDIHEHKEAQVELQAAHGQVVDILESISDAFYTLDEDWRFTYVNRRAEQVWSRQRETLIGKSIWDEFPETVDAYPYQQLQRVAQERQPLEFESLSPVRQTWIEITVYPGEKGLSVYFRDIHERKQAQQRAAVLQEITAELSSAVTLDQVAEVVVSKGVAALGGHIGTIMLLSEDGQTLELLSTRGATEETVNAYRRFPIEFKSPISDAARTGLPLWIET
ncbi:MAG: PAS domain S-box protein, partial [Burkholderiales bacterium]|nr:PAS domain S-box protein [Anaerolineae bacterium]